MNEDVAQHDHQNEIGAVGRIEAIPTILDVVCRTTGMGFAAVARVTDDRWIVCQVLDNSDFGLESGDELKAESTICHKVRQTRELIVIEDVEIDPVHREHRATAQVGFRSYISVPICLKDGRFFGTLCALGHKPARLKTPETIGMFKLFADLIATHLESDDRLRMSGKELSVSRKDLRASREELRLSQEDLRVSNAALLEEQGISELREQFIAVLGHDLRNPLASISGAARMLAKDPPAERRAMLLDTLQASVVRMAGLIDNVLDFARGRLGAGIPLELRPDVQLTPVLEHLVQELRVGVPDRLVVIDFHLPVPIRCDPSRISQLVSNLLGNALTHGSPDEPVRIHAESTAETLTIWVANGGAAIAPAAMQHLFQPFFRGQVRPSQQGLGLGLHIASEIAKAHDGTLSVTSSTEETRFTFQMPLDAA